MLQSPPPNLKISFFKNLINTNMSLHNACIQIKRPIFFSMFAFMVLYGSFFIFTVIFAWFRKIGLILLSFPRIFMKLRQCTPFQIINPICKQWTNGINYNPYRRVVGGSCHPIVIGLFSYVEQNNYLKILIECLWGGGQWIGES